MNNHIATPISEYIADHHGSNVTHAAAALGVDRATLHRVMNTAFVIDGTLYTIKRKAL